MWYDSTDKLKARFSVKSLVGKIQLSYKVQYSNFSISGFLNLKKDRATLRTIEK